MSNLIEECAAQNKLIKTFHYNNKVKITDEDSFYYGSEGLVIDRATSYISGKELRMGYIIVKLEDNVIVHIPPNKLEIIN